ncbi:MAG: hypothetical protein HZC49_04740 [Nitrospirae bacterium]|nr:hypothetical protein [Nitrospirota bacterium]
MSARATNIHDTIENSRKKKLWLYVPLAMVVIIVFVIALPVMIKKFNHAPTDYVQAPAESTVNNSIEKDKSVSSSYNAQKNGKDLNIPSAPVQQTGTKDSVFAKNDKAFNLREASTGKDSTGILPTKSIAETEKSKKGDNAAPLASMEKTIKNPSQANNADILKPELSAVAKAEPGKVESQNKIDLIAKIDEAFKDLRAIQNEKPVKADADIKTEKTPEVKPLAKTEEQPVKLQVAKLEDTPAAAAITESQSIPVVKQEVNTLEEKKSSITSTGQSVRRQEMPNVALLVKRFNPRTGPNVSPSTPGVTTSDLLKKWKHIGSTNSGVPLFISPDNISYPYEHVVNLLVKASVNKKDFVDLLAINCSQIKLRILEERNGNNPVFSSYSAEWKDIIPDSMILYKSACPEKK